MDGFKLLAVLFSRRRYAQFVAFYGVRYIVMATVFFALSSAALAGLAAFSAGKHRQYETLQARGLAAQASILELEISKNGRKSEHHVTVIYEFEDRDGKHHIGRDKRSFKRSPGLTKSLPVDVLYDPNTPGTSTIVLGLAEQMDGLILAIYLGISGFVFFGAFVLRYLQWRRNTLEGSSVSCA